jgi:hypothetical protein
MNARVRAAGLISGGILLFFTAVLLRGVTSRIYSDSITDDDRYYLPPAKWLRIMSLGFNEAAADLIWIKTVVYFGGQWELRKIEAEDNFTVNYLGTAVELDPRFRSVYTIGSAITLFQDRGHVTEKTVKMTMELLDRGVREFPGDGDILFNLGFMHYFEMRPFMPNDPQNPKTKYHRDIGAQLIGRSALMKGAPPYAALLSITVLSREGFDDLIVEHLKAQLARETDENIRKELKIRLRREIGKAAERDILITEKLQEKWRTDLPFIPFDFYLALQPQFDMRETIDPLFLSDQLLDMSSRASEQ